MSDSITQLLQKANDVREQDNLSESLILFDEAILKSTEQKDYSSLIDAFHGKILTNKHFYLTTKDTDYRDIAQDLAQKALKICQDFQIDNKLSVCYFRLGEIDMLFEDYPKAIVDYQKSLDFYGQENSETGDYLYHLGEAIFRSGDQQKGEQTILKGLEIIKKHQENTDKFLIHVWLSGAYLRLTELIYPINREKSQNYFLEAQKIINSDSKLVIRQRQMQQLAQRLNLN